MLHLVENSCALRIGVLGINFQTAPLDLREKISRSAAALSGEKGFFFQHSTIVLSTCNRTEIYFAGEDLAQIHSDLLAFLRFSLPTSFEQHLYSYFGIDCFAHLGKVTSGLDSAILLETEIQRQVKVAYEQTAKQSFLSPSLHYIFQKALKIGKEIRNEWPSHIEMPSLFSTIWNLSSNFFSNISEKKILFVGYSELNRRLLASFSRKKLLPITVCTQSFIHRIDCLIVGREILSSWQDFDLIICASKTDRYLIEGKARENQLIFDLSVPRNVSPKVAELCRLYNMEEINALMTSYRKRYTFYLEKSKRLVDQSVRRLAQIYRDKQRILSDSYPIYQE